MVQILRKYRIIALRVQVPNNHILTQNPYYNYYYPKPKYLIIGYMDPLGCVLGPLGLRRGVGVRDEPSGFMGCT